MGGRLEVEGGAESWRDWRAIAKECRAPFWGDENILKLIVVITAQLNILNPLELYSLKGWIVWHVSYISIKLLLKM